MRMYYNIIVRGFLHDLEDRRAVCRIPSEARVLFTGVGSMGAPMKFLSGIQTMSYFALKCIN